MAAYHFRWSCRGALTTRPLETPRQARSHPRATPNSRLVAIHSPRMTIAGVSPGNFAFWARVRRSRAGNATKIAVCARFSCSLVLQVHENVALSPILNEPHHTILQSSDTRWDKRPPVRRGRVYAYPTYALSCANSGGESRRWPRFAGRCETATCGFGVRPSTRLSSRMP